MTPHVICSFPGFTTLLSVTACFCSAGFSPLAGQPTGQGINAPVELKHVSRDVRYGEHPRNLLDFFPSESTSPAPVLIFFHGGGFVGGDKLGTQQRPIVRDCLANGVSVVSANYRFVTGPDSEPFPGSLMDGVRVVQFVRSKATDWNLDPEQIVLSGSSAGALMSLWIALHEDLADANNDDPLARQSSRVRGVVAYAGPTTVDPRVIIEQVGGNPNIHPSVFPIFDIKRIEDLEQPAMREKVKEFSPLSHVSCDDPPLQLRYGGTLAGTPLPATTSVGVSIHHAEFGALLRDRFREIGCQQSIELVCADCPQAGATELDFLRKVLDLKNPKENPSAE